MADMSKLKVAITTHFPLDPNKPKGGVEAVTSILARHLASLPDLEVHVVTLRPEAKYTELKKMHGFTLHILPLPRGSALLTAIGTGRRLLCEYLKGLSMDLVHAHDTYGIMVKGLSLPRVFTVHGFIYGDTLVSGRRFPRLRSLIWKWVETSAWRDQHRIISISPYVRERLCFFGVAPERIVDIDNPIHELFFKLEPQPDNYRLLCCAVISPRKNTLALIHALSRLNEKGLKCQLRLAGHVVDSRYYRKLLSEVQRLGLEEQVNFLGALTSEQIRDELTKAKVFLLVSLEENSPLVIEEAMAAGVPVITSNRCGMPYMVSHEETGFLVNPRDVSEIASRIKELVTDDNLAQKMGNMAKKMGKRRFHPQKIAMKTQRVYEETLKKV